MPDRAHIVTQIRRAFRDVLAPVVGAEHITSISRAQRKFQTGNFPVVMLVVTDDKTGTSEDGIDTYNMTVVITISDQSGFDDVEDSIDAMRLKVEQALIQPRSWEFGKCWNFKIASMSNPDLEDVPNSDAIIWHALIPITFTLSTRPYDPTTNLNY